MCNICEQRTLRRVNPVALETGTTFVQCRCAFLRVAAASRCARPALGRRASRAAIRVSRARRRSNPDCLVYHKLVDNLGLFHELQARQLRGRCAARVVPWPS